ncbi:MAG: hypothetical protein BWZ03_00588 [bacterium ADurb.BinA186]|nr:MAG: hypothetical protein BWZ03_00588 [bacterium ADurb.BinA186]
MIPTKAPIADHHDTFLAKKNAIVNDNLSPRDAANRAGATDFKPLSNRSYQIKQRKQACVKMSIYWDEQHVKILQVGGHT